MPRKTKRTLTPRELTVLALIATGATDKKIALKLGISPLTVHKHVQNILAKLRAASRTEAAVRAVRERIIEPREMSGGR